MAELADALALGASSRKAVQVQVLFRAPSHLMAIGIRDSQPWRPRPTPFELSRSASRVPVGIPVKVNGDSSGKPNGVPLKANSRRSEATLAS